MLTVQVSINGIPIIVVNAFRDMDTPSVDQNYMYRYSGTTLSAEIREPPTIYTGQVRHKYSDGLDTLTQILMADIMKKTRKH